MAWVVSEKGLNRDALVGSTALVTVPFNNQHPGRIQVDLDGTLLSLQATTEAVQEFEAGDRVLILDLTADYAVVTAKPS